MLQPISVHCKDGTIFAPNLRNAIRLRLGDDRREHPIFEDMVLYHDREVHLLFVEYLPFRRLPGGETEIPGIGIVRRPPPGMVERYMRRVEISPDEAQTLAEICSVALPPGFLPERLRPVWDRRTKQLKYGEIVCRRYRRVAPRQFEILEAFEAEGWPQTVKNPFPGDKQLRDTVDDLKQGLIPLSPICFEVKNVQPAWSPRPS
jgi:hypothetical protein